MLIDEGVAPETVKDVLNKITFSEYKRRQSAPGPQGLPPRLRHGPPRPHRAGVQRLVMPPSFEQGEFCPRCKSYIPRFSNLSDAEEARLRGLRPAEAHEGNSTPDWLRTVAAKIWVCTRPDPMPPRFIRPAPIAASRSSVKQHANASSAAGTGTTRKACPNEQPPYPKKRFSERKRPSDGSALPLGSEPELNWRPGLLVAPARAGSNGFEERERYYSSMMTPTQSARVRKQILEGIGGGGEGHSRRTRAHAGAGRKKYAPLAFLESHSTKAATVIDRRYRVPTER